jgi:hypothetical protein
VILGRWNHIEVAAKACSKDLVSRHSTVDNEGAGRRAPT